MFIKFSNQTKLIEMTSIQIEDEQSRSKESEALLELLRDPIRAQIFFVILRYPDVTPIELKKQLKIPGNRIYWHLDKLKDGNVIYESGTARVNYKSQVLIRKKFQINPSLLNNLDTFSQREYYLFQLYLSTALLQLETRKLRTISDADYYEYKSGSMMKYTPDRVNTFVDGEVAELLKSRIDESLQMCMDKYDEIPIADAIKSCRYGVITAIFPFPEKEQSERHKNRN